MNRQSTMCVVLAVFVPSLIIRTNAEFMQWTLEKNTGIRFVSHFAETTALGVVNCAYQCLQTGRCSVANYNSGTMACNLIEGNPAFVSDINWESFVVVSGMPDFLIHLMIRLISY